MHPVSFDAAYEVERNRITTFFRLLLAIPWLLWMYVYAIGAMIAVVIAWFAMMFTKRYPEGLYNFVAGYLRYVGRLAGWVSLTVDDLPPFGGGSNHDYPVRVDVAPRQEEYSRAKTFFKPVLYFPQMLISYGAQGLVGGAAFVSWWRILFTGKQSATMHDALLAGLAYVVRSQGFVFLLTETHPRLLELTPPSYPADAPALTAAPAALPGTPPPPVSA